jgi:DNA topoisomerase I
MKLVIVESPTKTKKIGAFLGKDFKVISSVGHIRDLPKSNLGVDTEKKFKPEYELVAGKSDVISELKKQGKLATEVYLATDPDREGEAIAFHIAYVLGYKNKTAKADNLHRVTFNEITKEAVLEAFKAPREVDMNLVDSQQARRVLDRLVGYKLSPLIWKKIRYGLSAGRVQSVATRLVVERENEINKFNKEVFYTINADVVSGKETFISNLYSIDKAKVEVKEKVKLFAGEFTSTKTIIQDKNQLAKILKDIKGNEFKVIDVNKSESQRAPLAPYTTSTLQQEASWRLGFSPKRTMQIAQKLYENGHITYMRTDSTNLAVTAVADIRKYLKQNFKPEYLSSSEKHFETKSKVAQEAHEAIRPTHAAETASKLKLTPEQIRLYTMIWQRTIATQMANAVYDKTRIEILVKGSSEYIFRTTGSIIKFEGYLKVYENTGKDVILPNVKVGDTLKLKELASEEKLMSPPARYNQASLIKELENFEIGRPSTYASIIDTIEKRGYVEVENKVLKPTDTGVVVTDLLKDHFKNIVDLDFTAKMENDLDEVANGTVDWEKMMKDFYTPFAKDIKVADKKIKKDDYTNLGKAPTDMKCPVCKKAMIVKLSRNGKFYSCADFPDCQGLRGMDGKTEEDYAKKANTKEFKEMYNPAPKTTDNRDFVLKHGRFGEFWAHPDYPEVKETAEVAYTDKKKEELYGKAPKAKDGSIMVFKKGRFGPYWAHINYPEVKETVRIKVEKSSE